MKKLFLTFVFAIVATLAAMAQQISVVSTTGATTLYRTLPEAIKGADPGSVIYLPGGGFSIADSVKITKKLTIIGIGHYGKSGNVDGVTTISGNLFFNAGSSGSAVMGCYITGDVNIGDGEATVTDMLIRYCNVNSVQVKNSSCSDVIVNQNYIRNLSNFSSSPTKVTNNVCLRLFSISGGIVSNNIITFVSQWDTPVVSQIKNSVFCDNIILNSQSDTYGYYSTFSSFSNNTISGNVVFRYQYNEQQSLPNSINLTGKAWTMVFVNANGGAISPVSDFHFKEDYQQYSSCGIYGGTGFNDNQIAPVPYIVAKHVDEQTDASGKLNVKIRVKASGEE